MGYAMRRIGRIAAALTLACCMTAVAAPAGDDAATASEQDAEGREQSAEKRPAGAPDESTRAPSAGGLRETVTETMRTFTPSEAIDVDKPVDFPANI